MNVIIDRKQFPYISTQWKDFGFSSEADLMMTLSIVGQREDSYAVATTPEGKQVLVFNSYLAPSSNHHNVGISVKLPPS